MGTLHRHEPECPDALTLRPCVGANACARRRVLSLREQEKVTRKFVSVSPLSCVELAEGRCAEEALLLNPRWCLPARTQAVHQLLGPREAIPAPDIGSDERHSSWIFDQVRRGALHACRPLPACPAAHAEAWLPRCLRVPTLCS